MKFKIQLEQGVKEGWLSEKMEHRLSFFYFQGIVSMNNQKLVEAYDDCFTTFLNLLKHEHKNPFVFHPYHRQVRSPFDYYTFGNQMFKLLIDEPNSKILGSQYIEEVREHLQRGDNVVFLANHQTEADPMAISVLLDSPYPGLAENIIFVAGERVISDPMAIPFSMGRNLICIHSKRHIDHPPEKKLEKQHHNRRTMIMMSQLLKEGGKLIYVAPSGGRDRPNQEGKVEVAPFDPNSLEMFCLMADKAKTPTHFYPMALATYDILPPPETIERELGEKRQVKRSPVYLAIGPRMDMSTLPNPNLENKEAHRKARAHYAWSLVAENYEKLLTI